MVGTVRRDRAALVWSHYTLTRRTLQNRTPPTAFMKLKIEPLWAGLATFVASLYTWWSMEHIYADMSRGNGTGIMVFYIISIFAFPIILGVAWILVALVLASSKGIPFRATVIVASTGVFFLLHGALGPIPLLIGAGFSGYMYIQTQRTWEDEEELKRFE